MGSRREPRAANSGAEIVETLLSRGLIAAEDAAALLARDLGADPAKSIAASGLVDLSGSRPEVDLGSLLAGLSGPEDATRLQRGPRPASPELPEQGAWIAQVEAWESALEAT